MTELTKTQKIILAVLGVTLLIFLAVWLFRSRTRKQEKQQEEGFLGDEALLLAEQIDDVNDRLGKVEKQQEEQKEQEKPNDNFPLRKGSVGKRVEQLQAFLVRKFGANIIANGIWDEKTQKAVEKHLKQTEISENIFSAYNLSNIKTSIFK